MEFTIIDGIKILAAFQAFLFAIYLFSIKTDRKISNFFIGLFLLFNCYNLGITVFNDFIAEKFTNLHILLTTTAFMIPASLFFYIESSINPKFELNWKNLLHLTPFIAINLLIIKTVYLENLKENPTETDFHLLLNKLFYFFWYFLLFTYGIVSFFKLKKYKKLYIERFSNTDLGRHKYLVQLNTIVFIVYILSATKNFLSYNVGGVITNYAIHIVALALLILFCWIIYKGLNTPELFKNDEEELPLVKVMVKNTKDAEKLNDSSKDEVDQLTKKIKLFMKSKEPYLDPSLSLHELAKQTEIPVRELSLLINHHLNKHFFDFVNEYRIKKAAELLVLPERKDHTVLEILYEVGFNSKSSFNTAFKKQMNSTPTQYRLSHSKSA